MILAAIEANLSNFTQGGPVRLFDVNPLGWSLTPRTDFPYPAPGLNDVADSGNLASDPAWSAPLLGMAAQADMDNRGVALRAPMAQWTGKLDPSKTPINAQDFANIYAWLKTQTSP